MGRASEEEAAAAEARDAPSLESPAAQTEEFLLNEAYVRDRAAEYESLGVRSVADYFEAVRARHGGRPALRSVEDPAACLTYDQLDARSNRAARWMVSRGGVRPGSVVALMMRNCPEFVVTWLALVKAGCVVACINTRLRGKHLDHAVKVADAGAAVVEAAMADAWATAGGAARACRTVRVSCSPEAPAYAGEDAGPVPREWRAAVRMDDPCFYIYTSGTTGPSKAALFSHRRFLGAGLTWCRPMRLTPDDVFYITLPLYHGNGGVVAVSAAWQAGCCAVVRRSFSVSSFWGDVARFGCTATIYIGELFRYLYYHSGGPGRGGTSLRVVAGNGLRADIWGGVMRRFGVRRIVEHYGLSELPAGPLMNVAGRPGSCGFVPPDRLEPGETASVRLVEFDVVENRPTRRGAGHFCVPVERPGRPGELLLRLTAPYRGYTDEAATARRVYADVFEKGDRWFATGDLLQRDDDGYFYFVDRVGDTFRWKGENVSTQEVTDVVAAFGGVREANTYGVEYAGREGRAGMVSLAMGGDANAGGSAFDGRAFFAHVQALAPFAQPLFARVLPAGAENRKTTTLKFQKFDYAVQGFDPAAVAAVAPGDALYFRDDAAKAYVPLTPALHRRILEPSFRV